MKPIQLSKRLSVVASYIGKADKVVADVGCDHGKLLGYLLQNNLITRGIATDISEPSVKKAELLYKQYGLKNVSVRVGNGLSTITNEDNVTTAIIAGMGGWEIKEIIQSFLTGGGECNHFILAPQHGEKELRIGLNSFNITIKNDIIIKDGKRFYTILNCYANNKKQRIKPLFITFGKDNFKKNNPEFWEYLQTEEMKVASRLPYMQKYLNEIIKAKKLMEEKNAELK